MTVGARATRTTNAGHYSNTTNPGHCQVIVGRLCRARSTDVVCVRERLGGFETR